MSDLGAITRAPDVAYQGSITGPGYAGGTITAPFALNGDLSGAVSAGGSPVVGAKLYLYWRASMQMIARAFTDASGNYSFSGIANTGSPDYTILAFDPAGGTQYNDQIMSLLTPG